jgi:thioredoxin reductase (NADPH)
LAERLDLIIIGGGPAGMTAGLYAARAKLKVRLLERIAPGGQILNTHWVDNYPGFPDGVSGFELVDRMRKQALRFELDITAADVVGLTKEGDLFQVQLASGDRVEAKAVILAMGAKPIKLGIPGEEELVGKGVSYCATCDGPFYREMEVAVVGGGDTAVEEALFLTKFASKVHLFHRRNHLRAAGILRDQILSDPKVHIHWSTVLTSVEHDEQGLVSGVNHKHVATGSEALLPVSGVFMFVGQSPTTDILVDFVELDAAGFVMTDQEMATNIPGVWAAGDIRSKALRQISTAVGEGATAAFQAEKYIEGHS